MHGYDDIRTKRLKKEHIKFHDDKLLERRGGIINARFSHREFHLPEWFIEKKTVLELGRNFKVRRVAGQMSLHDIMAEYGYYTPKTNIADYIRNARCISIVTLEGKERAGFYERKAGVFVEIGSITDFFNVKKCRIINDSIVIRNRKVEHCMLSNCVVTQSLVYKVDAAGCSITGSEVEYANLEHRPVHNDIVFGELL
ncbi:Uncharacterised protein [uncultured archaeon]|nr:Uncharacterised protein [uncultured archaeon]